MHTKNLAPLLYIQSDCDTASNRDVYVTELMKYIRVDSYGACLNNAEFDKRLNCFYRFKKKIDCIDHINPVHNAIILM